MNFKNKDLKILGISAFYHDSAATLVVDGEIITAIQEERFTRKKNDSSFPINAIKYSLINKNLDINDLDYIIYYEKPLLTFERLLETYLAVAPRGLRSFMAAMQIWLKKKLFIKTIIKNELNNIHRDLNGENIKPTQIPKIIFSEHHLSHAAAAFYPSPFQEAAILCMDGVGEWATTSVWMASGKKIKPIWEISFPHSLGLLYSAFTYYCGFKVNSGEYKLMGLAPYGNPKYVDLIKNKLINIKNDGTFKLNMKYFKFHRGFRMTGAKFNLLFGKPPRKIDSEIDQFYMDIAASIQLVTEEIVLLIAKTIRKETGLRNLCLSGGVALNCVANGKLLQNKIFDKIWIQPASGDAGSSLGAALVAHYEFSGKDRIVNLDDSMRGSFLGPKFSNKIIKEFLDSVQAKYAYREDKLLFNEVADLLANGNVVGWFNGPMEFGPRALGGRSILGDPRELHMQKKINLKIKFRESFRPFAPSILEEDLSKQFDLNIKSPYMLLVVNVKNSIRKKLNKIDKSLSGLDKLNVTRSQIAAVTHVDFSARVQTVNKKINPRYYKLIETFKEKTGCPSIINTSFNVRGEPIVCSPSDALNCFMKTEMDILVIENFILYKRNQSVLK